MKKRTLVLSILLTLALVFGSFSSVFAATEKTGPATEATKTAIEKSGIQTVKKFNNEFGAESYSINFVKEVLKGKYKVIGTSGVKKAVKKGDAVIVDTMPAGWWNQRRIPGSINSVVGAMNGPEFKILSGEKKALKKAVKKACTEYYNEKTKKWQNTKPAKKYFKQKKTRVNKNKKIIVYCGFVGCARSHQGAMYLKKLGYKKVYRYPGGIAAWVEGGNNIAGTDVK